MKNYFEKSYFFYYLGFFEVVFFRCSVFFLLEVKKHLKTGFFGVVFLYRSNMAWTHLHFTLTYSPEYHSDIINYSANVTISSTAFLGFASGSISGYPRLSTATTISFSGILKNSLIAASL